MNLTTSASSAVTLTGTSSKRGGSRRVPARRVRAASVDRELGELQGDVAVHGRDLVEDPERRIANPSDGRMVDGRYAGHAIGERDDVGGDGASLGLITLEDALVGAIAEHAGEPRGQRDGVLDAGVHALAACWAVHVRGVAGEEHAALAVAVGEPVVDAKPRTPHDVLDQRGSL